MDVPVDCSGWRGAMSAFPETRAILQRLEDDDCLPADIVREFFASLKLEITNAPFGGGGDYAAAMWARNCLFRVLDATVGKFNTRGAEVPANRFRRLCRVRAARDYKWCLPSSPRNDFFSQFFIDDVAWATADDAQLRTWIEGHRLIYKGPLQTAGRRATAWVTDTDAVPLFPRSFAWLQTALTLELAPENRTLGIVCDYARAAVPSLHVPRSFDGLDFPLFNLETDCAVLQGHTKPLAGIRGLPEAVHLACDVDVKHQISFELAI